MQRTSFGEMHCSIARALEILGEPWTPLILRDLLGPAGGQEEIIDESYVRDRYILGLLAPAARA